MQGDDERDPVRSVLSGLTVLAAIAALLVGLAPAPGVAQETDEVTTASDAMSPPGEAVPAPALDKREITLSEAVRVTLRADPRLQAQKQQVAQALGALQQARGLFDPVVSATPGYTMEYREIFPALRRQQRDKRRAFEQLRDGAAEFLADVNPLLAELNARDLQSLEDFEDLQIPACPPGFADLLFDPADFNFNVAEDSLQRADADPFDSLVGTTIIIGSPLGNDTRRLLEICDPSVPGASGGLGRLQEILDLDVDLTGNLLETFNSGKEVLEFSRELGELLREKALLVVERLGGIPKDEISHEFSLELSAEKPFRNGMNVGFDVTLQSAERNFEGKSPDPAFGALGFPTRFPNSVAVRLDVPLGKGRGRVSAAAPERAAEAIVSARRERLRHAASAETFSTVIAFISLASAQERLALLEESAERQQRIVESTEELVQAGQVVGAERDRAAARAASVRRSVAVARLEVLRARLVLADAMGVQVESLQDAPLAAQELPRDVGLEPDLGRLIDAAPERRRDVRSFESSLEAAQIQAEAAEADLKRTFDLSLRAGMSTLYESPFFKVFEEERDEPAVDEPVRFYDPRGILRSFDANWEPFLVANFTMTFPVQNNVAEGRLVRRRSQLTSTEIGLTNLERVIRQNVVDVGRALEHARRAVERRQQSVEWLEETLEGDLQRYRFADLTLIDALLTEENLTRERLELVSATQTYLSLVARLQFETGRLVRFTAEDTENEQVKFDDERVWGTE